jgi:tRNA(Ile)-lysidine synthetase-like protein
VTDPLPPDPHFTIPHNTTIIVGLSGGPDSVCLLHLVLQQKKHQNLHIIAAHLDHEWQESSKIAVKLCQDICNRLDVPLVVKKLSELKFEAKWNGSQEELGRKMRRFFFESVAHEYQADAIALAHHQQDQQETFFIRLLRGSSLTGLIGIKENDGLYVRPILNWSKKEILQYLTDHNLAYYTDPTNVSDAYLRNRIRNHLIPTMIKIDPRCESSLQSTMQQLSLSEDFIQQQTLLTMQNLRIDQGIDTTKFLQLHTVLQQNILLQLMIQNNVSFSPSQKLFKEIMRFLEKSSKDKHTLYQTWMIQKNKSFFYIAKIIKSDKNL